MSHNNTYTRNSFSNDHMIVSTYSTDTNQLILEEIFDSNILWQREEFVNKNGTLFKIQKKFYDNGNISEFSEFIENTRVGIHEKFCRCGISQFVRNYNIHGQLL